ncbi:MAG: TRAP transporter substrate-binding protein [Corticimicrobacter sp.]|uniref:TRAP transporter substrate-binding protein n=1 Tax=Corticimicrobacter sp. TaxID=2678536 RepID=UPI0032D9EE80
MKKLGYALALGTALSLGQAQAQDAALPELQLRAIGANSTFNLWTDLEQDWYAKQIPAASGGQITIEALPHDVAGLKGPEILSFLQNGAIQFASQAISYMAGDDPRFEAVDLAGLTLDVPTAMRAIDAYRPVLERVMAERFNVKLLGLAPMSAQVFWCRDQINDIDSLKGKKIRVFNASLTDLVNGVQGSSVTIPFVEAVPALQRGVADCGVTGAISGYRAKWYDVTKTLYPLNSGWSTMFWGANLDAWNALPSEAQVFLQDQYHQMETRLAEMAAAGDEQAMRCSTGQDCTDSHTGRMTLTPLSETDNQRRLDILQNHVLPGWAKRCGKDCTDEWNATVGRELGLTAEAR